MSGRSMSEITDGTSNSFAIGECTIPIGRSGRIANLAPSSAGDITGIPWWWGGGTGFFATLNSAEQAVCNPGRSLRHCGNSPINSPLYALVDGRRSPEADNRDYAAPFFSFHPGGANFSFADGHVTFVNENIDFLTTYKWLGAINDGEVLGDF